MTTRQEDLFSPEPRESMDANRPLAVRMRPLSFSEVIGQDHLLAENGLLTRALAADACRALLFHGPPGTGKTTLARLVAETTNCRFQSLNAVLSGVHELRTVVNEAERLLRLENRITLVFVDEIHRFNKAQQDALLPYVEEGVIRFVGATTGNPAFAVVPALRSRTLVLELKPLTTVDIAGFLRKTLTDPRGFAGRWTAEEGLLTRLARAGGGDLRRALNLLEMVIRTAPGSHVREEDIPEALSTQPLRHDKDGDDHYDVVSALIKSMRGSDLDATAYWLARMIETGEDPRFIARRIMIAAAEDVGLADPRALTVAVSAWQATETIGMPEARILLSMAALYVASAPKSNTAYLAIDDALERVRGGEFQEVPHSLCNLRPEKYRYPHDHPGGWVEQDYLNQPLKIVDLKPIGYESKIREYLERLKGRGSSRR